MARVWTCFAAGSKGKWEACCLDLDLTVTGPSFESVKATLEDAISSYIEDASNERPEQARRLLNRRAPWHLRFGLMVRFIIGWLWTTNSQDGDRAGFTITCSA